MLLIITFYLLCKQITILFISNHPSLFYIQCSSDEISDSNSSENDLSIYANLINRIKKKVNDMILNTLTSPGTFESVKFEKRTKKSIPNKPVKPYSELKELVEEMKNSNTLNAQVVRSIYELGGNYTRTWDKDDNNIISSNKDDEEIEEFDMSQYSSNLFVKLIFIAGISVLIWWCCYKYFKVERSS